MVMKIDNVLQSNGNRGVTLIELVVVLAIFMLCMGTAVTLFVAVVGHQKRILQEQELLNQGSYAIEYMARAIRTAVKDVLGTCLQEDDNDDSYPGHMYLLTNYDTASGFYRGIKFIADDGACRKFYVGSDNVLKEVKDGGVPQNIMSDKFQIKYGRFVINGDKTIKKAWQKDGIQPRITILLDVKTQLSGSQQEKIIQTTISQRNLNL